MVSIFIHLEPFTRSASSFFTKVFDMEKITLNKLTKEERKNFFQSKYDYYKAFNAFITDLRGELNTKLGSTIGQDLTQMKVLIGQIAETFGTKDMDTTAYNNKVAQNQNFIKVQNFIANNIYGIETFNTQAYPLNRLIGGKNHVFGSQYSDHYHWGEDAMFAIGRGVGEKLYNSDLLK